MTKEELENDLERFKCMVLDKKLERIEFERDNVCREHFEPLVQFYWTLHDWEQKAAIIDLLQDKIDTITRQIMLDFLNAPPDKVGDYLQTCKIIALCHLEGNLNNFTKYYKNRDLIQHAVKEYLKEIH
jgi:hypothetical protein